ncbi:hypothetical protein BO71DRAFT_466979 [Aspergillus ellipticus CBS 707.79]|uniref:Lipocalin-like domain-containing protein n=1 Tax=Aspergillus ellipticus CBS 707.79 TaxID=1448320 RepID=A0A319DJ17_9EURO|nr:hypothetical protein BO71DRAFT_466979 [Aspergillus ellipticus CBS 707.79]
MPQPTSTPTPTKPTPNSSLLGTWSLLNYSSTPFSGHGPTIHSMGPDAHGLLTYTADGYMTITVMSTTSNKVKHSIQDGLMYAGWYWVDRGGGGGGGGDDDDGGGSSSNGALVNHQVQMACPHELEGTVLRRRVTVYSRWEVDVVVVAVCGCRAGNISGKLLEGEVQYGQALLDETVLIKIRL